MIEVTRLKNTFLISLFIGIFVFSLFTFFKKNIQPRFVYYFYSYNNDKIYTEIRRANNEIEQDKVKFFVDDLLLGPMTNRYKTLFPIGTKLDFCFSKNKELNLGLSTESISIKKLDKKALEKGVALLRLNILRNFKNYNKINIYIDGNYI